MDWKVKYIDYPAHFKKMEEELMATIRTVLSRGNLILRQELRDFEDNFAEFVGTKYAVGVSNCTDGLLLSLKAIGIGKGDEVITVSHTFVATAEAIKHLGAKPVFADIGDDHNMDISLLEPLITRRTKAVIPVHLNGRLCNMTRLMPICKKHRLAVIEDAAQAIGASLNGRNGGTFGVTGCFSFYPAKILGAFGDAGAVVTDNKKTADKIRLLRDHGRGKNNKIELWGFNCRMDNLQAAILDLKLKKVPEWISRRREIAKIYEQGLKGVKELRLPPPPDNGAFFDTFQNYEIEAENRSGLRSHLAENGVETMLPWGGKGIHQFRALSLGYFRLPHTEKFFSRGLMLPMHPDLADGQIEYVVSTVKKFYKTR